MENRECYISPHYVDIDLSCVDLGKYRMQIYTNKEESIKEQAIRNLRQVIFLIESNYGGAKQIL